MTTIDTSDITRSGPLGGSQEWEWHQLKCGRSVNIAATLRLRTPRSPHDAVKIIGAVLEKHEALRSIFSFDDGGAPIQHVRRTVEFGVEQRACADDSEVYQFKVSLLEHRFSLESSTFVRVGLALSGAEVINIIVVVNHAFADGYGCRILVKDLDAAFHGSVDGAAGAVAIHQSAHQFLDSALSEAAGPLSELRSSAARFWQRELEHIPHRLFPKRSDTSEFYGSEYESTTAPAAFALASRSFNATPAAIYFSLIAVIASILSGVDTPVVRNHFMGRTPEEMNTIGCYHRILPVMVDLGDHPSLRTAIARASSKFLRVQSRSRIGYLQMNHLMKSWEMKRGVEFSDGVTINFDYRSSWRPAENPIPETLAELSGQEVGDRLLMGINDTVDDDIDAYLHVRLSRESILIYGNFNHESLTLRQMRTFLLGPELILRRGLAEGDVSWSGIHHLLDQIKHSSV